MTDLKISELPVADAFIGTEMMVVVQDGVTKRMPAFPTSGNVGQVPTWDGAKYVMGNVQGSVIYSVQWQEWLTLDYSGLLFEAEIFSSYTSVVI